MISSFDGMCTSPEDVCCKPKEENPQIQLEISKPTQAKPPIQSQALPETPNHSQQPSKPKCSDIPGFECLNAIIVSCCI